MVFKFINDKFSNVISLIFIGIIFISLYMFYVGQHDFIEELKHTSISNVDKIIIVDTDSYTLASNINSKLKYGRTILLNKKIIQMKFLLSRAETAHTPGHSLPIEEYVVQFVKSDLMEVQYTFVIYNRSPDDLYIRNEEWLENNGIYSNSGTASAVVYGGSSMFLKMLANNSSSGSSNSSHP